MKRYKATIIRYSKTDKDKLKNCEDSIEICPQIGERCLFVEDYHEPDLLDMDLIKLSEPFFIDDGTKYKAVTIDNYKELDKVDIISIKTDKYDEKVIISDTIISKSK